MKSVSNIMATKRKDPRLTRDYKAFRLKVLARDQWTCQYCQSPADTVDHVIPISVAPDLVVSFDNALACCKSCNSRKGSRSQGVFLEKMATPPVFQAYPSPTIGHIDQTSPFRTRPVTD